MPKISPAINLHVLLLVPAAPESLVARGESGESDQMPSWHWTVLKKKPLCRLSFSSIFVPLKSFAHQGWTLAKRISQTPRCPPAPTRGSSAI